MPERKTACRPVESFDIFFDSEGEHPIKDLIEDCHKNRVSPGILVFYLRTDRYDDERKEWVSQVPRIGCEPLHIAGRPAPPQRRLPSDPATN